MYTTKKLIDPVLACQYVTMLFTDLGVLTPSAVSDELIKLFT